MSALIGTVLAVATCSASTAIGFDRSRNFYPLVLIVISSYYILFAAIAGSEAALWQDGLIAIMFMVAAVIGFRTTPWLIVAALALHGAMDMVHHGLVANPGTPAWWPAFCAAFDLVAAAYFAVLIVVRRNAAASTAQAATGGSS